MDLKNKKVAFLGDSITAGAGASKYEFCFVETFGRDTGSAVINYGISGTRIAPQIKPSAEVTYDRDFISRVSEMDRDVDLVVVFGGTNDFGHGDAPFGEIGDHSEATFCGACYVLIKKLVEKYPNIPIVIMTPLHRLIEDSNINEVGLPCKPLKDYVKIIRKSAEMFSIPVIDLFSMSGMQPNVETQNKLYFYDGLHPNDLGHERIAEILKAFLQNNYYCFAK